MRYLDNTNNHYDASQTTCCCSRSPFRPTCSSCWRLRCFYAISKQKIKHVISKSTSVHVYWKWRTWKYSTWNCNMWKRRTIASCNAGNARCKCWKCYCVIRTLCLKNDSDIFRCNLSKRCPILVIFGRHITEKSAVKSCFISHMAMYNAVYVILVESEVYGNSNNTTPRAIKRSHFIFVRNFVKNRRIVRFCNERCMRRHEPHPPHLIIATLLCESRNTKNAREHNFNF